jgi:hypothetical protein
VFRAAAAAAAATAIDSGGGGGGGGVEDFGWKWSLERRSDTARDTRAATQGQHGAQHVGGQRSAHAFRIARGPRSPTLAQKREVCAQTVAIAAAAAAAAAETPSEPRSKTGTGCQQSRLFGVSSHLAPQRGSGDNGDACVAVSTEIDSADAGTAAIAVAKFFRRRSDGCGVVGVVIAANPDRRVGSQTFAGAGTRSTAKHLGAQQQTKSSRGPDVALDGEFFGARSMRPSRAIAGSLRANRAKSAGGINFSQITRVAVRRSFFQIIDGQPRL